MRQRICDRNRLVKLYRNMLEYTGASGNKRRKGQRLVVTTAARASSYR
ncbi:MAG: hypothetical protein ACLSFC_08040 [Enterocloster bolteae]